MWSSRVLNSINRRCGRWNQIQTTLDPLVATVDPCPGLSSQSTSSTTCGNIGSTAGDSDAGHSVLKELSGMTPGSMHWRRRGVGHHLDCTARSESPLERHESPDGLANFSIGGWFAIASWQARRTRAKTGEVPQPKDRGTSLPISP